MTTPNIRIDDFVRKIQVAFKVRGKKHNLSRLALEVSADPSYFRKMVNGVRPLREDILEGIADFFEIPMATWQLDVAVFARRIGYEMSIDELLADRSESDFEFKVRSRDKQTVDSIYATIGGFWHAYYRSTAQRDRSLMCRDLVYFSQPSGQRHIPTFVQDPEGSYDGSCFLAGSNLHIIVENFPARDEIVTYMLNRPRQPGAPMEGIMLCRSDGKDTFASIPAAARVYFGFLGTREQLDSDGTGSSAVELRLRAEIPRYLEKPMLSADEEEIWDRVNNKVGEREQPNALLASLRGR